MRKVLAGLFLAFAMLSAPTMAATAGRVAPVGSIYFDVHYGSQGLKIGEARHDWRFAGPKYEMSLNLEAKGLAGLFGLQYEQRSVGTVDGKGMRPERFSVDQRGRKLESAEFDWQAGRVSIRRDGNERRSGSIQPGDQDLLSLWHQARRVADSGKAVKLTVVTNKSVKQATLEPSGTETLKLWQAVAEPLAQAAEPGTVLRADASGVRVACGQGQLCLTQLQRPGGKRLNAADFLHGCPLQAGQRLVAA